MLLRFQHIIVTTRLIVVRHPKIFNQEQLSAQTRLKGLRMANKNCVLQTGINKLQVVLKGRGF